MIPNILAIRYFVVYTLGTPYKKDAFSWHQMTFTTSEMQIK